MTDADRQALVAQYLPLAYKLAHKAWQRGSLIRRLGALEDIQQSAVQALAEAAQNYDPDHTARASFKTYAHSCIVFRLRTFAREATLVHIPRNHFQEQNSDPAMMEQIDRAIHHGHLSEKAQNRNPDTHPAPEVLAERRELLTRGLAVLDWRRREIIRRRFGLGCRPQTLREIGDFFGIEKERVRQLEADSLRRMRLALSA